MTWRLIFAPERKSIDPKKSVIQVLARDGEDQVILFVQNGKLPQKRLGEPFSSATLFEHVSRELPLHANSLGSALSCLGADSGLISIF